MILVVNWKSIGNQLRFFSKTSTRLCELEDDLTVDMDSVLRVC